VWFGIKEPFPYFELLPKLGSSNVHEQKSTIFKVLPLLIIIKSAYWETESNVAVKLANWLGEQNVYFACVSKKNEFVEETEIWLDE